MLSTSDSKPLSGMTYWQRTFGCQMNENDSERIGGMLESCGAIPVLSIEEADIAVFLTCCVREKAETRLKGQVSSIKNIPPANGSERIVALGGCIGQLEGEALLEELDNVDVVFGTHNLDRLVPLILERMETGAPVAETLDGGGAFSSDLPFVRKDPWHAWVPIMTGCDNFCSYCIVPYVRGRERSRPIEDIGSELESMSFSKVKEITLLGQNVNSYGRDLYGTPRFSDVLDISARSGVERIRFVTSHPKDLSDDTIESMASHANIMPQLHLPLQSGSDRILSKMNRSYTVEDYLGLVDKVKEAIPGISLSTDIIIGFPGETQEDFSETLDVVEKVGYGQMFRFIYSKRPGTPAASMQDDTPREELIERFDRLERIAQESSLAENAKEIGKTVPVLVEGASKRDPGMLSGKSPKLQTVHARIDPGKDLDRLLGTIVDVRIDEATTNCLQGVLV